MAATACESYCEEERTKTTTIENTNVVRDGRLIVSLVWELGTRCGCCGWQADGKFVLAPHQKPI